MQHTPTTPTTAFVMTEQQFNTMQTVDNLSDGSLYLEMSIVLAVIFVISFICLKIIARFQSHRAWRRNIVQQFHSYKQGARR